MDKQNVVYTHNGMLFSSLRKKSKILYMLQYGLTLKNATLRKSLAPQKAKYCMIPLMCGTQGS